MNITTTITNKGVGVYGAYAFVGILHLALLRFYPGAGVPLSKVMLMPLLLLAVYRQTNARAREGKALRMLMGALLLSGLGDALLIRSEVEAYFMGGLASFLGAHLLYIALFAHIHRSGAGAGAGALIEPRVLPAVLVPILLLVVLFPRLGALALPVVGYVAVITLMWLMALSNRTRRRVTDAPGEGWGSATLLALGATLFVVSDATLACEKFLTPFPGARLTVMGTYILAQLALVRGFMDAPGIRNQS